MGGWVRGCREVGGRGYFGWMGGFGALGGWLGVVKLRGSVGWCVNGHVTYRWKGYDVIYVMDWSMVGLE